MVAPTATTSSPPSDALTTTTTTSSSTCPSHSKAHTSNGHHAVPHQTQPVDDEATHVRPQTQPQPQSQPQPQPQASFQPTYPSHTPHLYSHIRILATPSAGRGVFAATPLKAGTLLDISPVLVFGAEEYQRHARHTQLDSYTFVWAKGGPGGRQMALALGIGSLFNHDPAAPSVNYLLDHANHAIRYVLVRDVGEGEELCISYGAGRMWWEDQGDDDRRHESHCSSSDPDDEAAMMRAVLNGDDDDDEDAKDRLGTESNGEEPQQRQEARDGARDGAQDVQGPVAKTLRDADVPSFSSHPVESTARPSPHSEAAGPTSAAVAKPKGNGSAAAHQLAMASMASDPPQLLWRITTAIDPSSCALELTDAWVVDLEPRHSGHFLRFLREHGQEMFAESDDAGDGMAHLRTFSRLSAATGEKILVKPSRAEGDEEQRLQGLLCRVSDMPDRQRLVDLLRRGRAEEFLLQHRRVEHGAGSASTTASIEPKVCKVPRYSPPSRSRVWEWSQVWPSTLRMQAFKAVGTSDATNSWGANVRPFIDREADRSLWGCEANAAWVRTNLRRCVDMAREARRRGEVPIGVHVTMPVLVDDAQSGSVDDGERALADSERILASLANGARPLSMAASLPPLRVIGHGHGVDGAPMAASPGSAKRRAGGKGGGGRDGKGSNGGNGSGSGGSVGGGGGKSSTGSGGTGGGGSAGGGPVVGGCGSIGASSAPMTAVLEKMMGNHGFLSAGAWDTRRSEGNPIKHAVTNAIKRIAELRAERDRQRLLSLGVDVVPRRTPSPTVRGGEEALGAGGAGRVRGDSMSVYGKGEAAGRGRAIAADGAAPLLPKILTDIDSLVAKPRRSSSASSSAAAGPASAAGGASSDGANGIRSTAAAAAASSAASPSTTPPAATPTPRSVANGQDYLLTSMALFTTHEPCVSCCMALVHSRVRSVFFLLPSPSSGGLCGSGSHHRRNHQHHHRPQQPPHHKHHHDHQHERRNHHVQTGGERDGAPQKGGDEDTESEARGATGHNTLPGATSTPPISAAAASAAASAVKPCLGGEDGGRFAVHEQSGLNHRFEVWRWSLGTESDEARRALGLREGESLEELLDVGNLPA